MAIKAANGRSYPRLVLGETISVAVETFRAHKTRFMLTALGMVIGTASLILVVTIGLTGKEYILRQIQAIGANMMVAYYQSGSGYGNTSSDYLTLEDMDAVRRQVPGITSSSPMLELHDRIAIPGGKERDVLILGVSSQYQWVRNLEIVAGRFFDESDVRSRSKIAVITVNLAIRLYGTTDAAVGQEMRLEGLPFIIVGVFKERVDTFGQSEISEETILIPHTVARFFMASDEVKQTLFLGRRFARGSAGDGADSADLEIEAPAGIGVQGRQFDPTPQRREQDRERADHSIAAHLGADVAGERRGHHEHHAGHGYVAHSRDRSAQSGGGDASRNPRAIPRRGDDDLA